LRNFFHIILKQA